MLFRSYLEQAIMDVYTETQHSDNELLFVGTSLGAWYAGWLAMKFYTTAVLINPRYSNKDFKTESTLPEDVRKLYDGYPFLYPPQTKFFIDPNDEVIDMTNLIEELKYTEKFLKYKPEYVLGATHRFNGEPFQKVIQFIQNETF